MKFFIASMLMIGSVQAFADSYLYECHATAIQAARAIDQINFADSNPSSTTITNDRSQRKNSAKIEVALDAARNREYVVKLTKNRSANLKGSEETGCFVESVTVK